MNENIWGHNFTSLHVVGGDCCHVGCRRADRCPTTDTAVRETAGHFSPCYFCRITSQLRVLLLNTQPHPVPQGILRFLQSNCSCPHPTSDLFQSPICLESPNRTFLGTYDQNMPLSEAAPFIAPETWNLCTKGALLIRCACQDNGSIAFHRCFNIRQWKENQSPGDPLSSAQNTDTLLLTRYCTSSVAHVTPRASPHGRCRNSSRSGNLCPFIWSRKDSLFLLQGFAPSRVSKTFS